MAWKRSRNGKLLGEETCVFLHRGSTPDVGLAGTEQSQLMVVRFVSRRATAIAAAAARHLPFDLGPG